MKYQYHVHKNLKAEQNVPDWDAPVWAEAEIADLAYFHPKSSCHRPRTQVKICYNPSDIFVLFRVEDRYVRSRHTEYNAKVHEDSCVEWFIQPPGSEGYYNIEVNGGGTLHVNYIIDPERDETGKRRDMRSIPPDIAKMIKIQSTLPRIVDPEIVTPVTWLLAIQIPVEFFTYFSRIYDINGSVWQGNLYKCGDKTSHPHWGAWKPIDELNFHQPACFGQFVFDP